METDREDLRVKKTKRLLVRSLLYLLDTKLFSHITVNDLCAKAMVSRSAFYQHFDDKYALLRYSMNIFNDILLQRLKGKPLYKYIRCVLDYVESNRHIIKNIIHSDFNNEIMDILLQPHLNNLNNIMLNQFEDTYVFSVPIELVSFYHSYGIINTIIMWVEKNIPYSVDEMTDYMITLLPLQLRDKEVPFA